MAKEKILVVDDEASHRTMLNAVLSSEGYQIFEADDGKTAIEAVEREFNDLILMDVRMTELDGIEALQEIKKISPEIPIIIMTAYGSVKTAVDALKSGAYDYLTKPLDIEEPALWGERNGKGDCRQRPAPKQPEDEEALHQGQLCSPSRNSPRK